MRPLILVIAVTLIAGSAHAEKAAARAEKSPEEIAARHHYEEGLKLYNLGEFGHAADEYKLAYKAKPDPVVLYNIAQAYRLGNDLPQALFFYRTFLRNFPNPPNRRDVEEKIRRLESQVSEQRAIMSQPPSTSVPPGYLPPAVPPTDSRTPPPNLPAPEPAPVAAPAETPAVVAATPPATAPADKPIYKRWWLWTTVGVVVVGVGLGVGLGLGLSSPQNPSTHFGTSTLHF